YLLQVRAESSNPQMAARAVEALARQSAQKGLRENAVHYYGILHTEYPQVVIRDGMTGEDFYKKMSLNKILLHCLEDADQTWRAGLGKNETAENKTPPSGRLYYFQPVGEPLPFFQKHRLALDMQTNKLKIIERSTLKEEVVDLPATNFQALLTA